MHEPMNVTTETNLTCLRSANAKQRMLSQRGEPLFLAGWHDALMIHFEVDAKALQRDVPYQLDLWNGRAFVSLVAFTMRNMRPRFGGKLAASLFRPIATHDFLNVRTYVRHGNETGIHFIAEWLTSRLAVMLGPSTFALPYRYGQISYDRDLANGIIAGCVSDTKSHAALKFEATLSGPAPFHPCAIGSLDEWLMERYTAFNAANGVRRFFRVWHPPWPERQAEVIVNERSLLINNWQWFESGRLIGANFSPGFHTVWMSRPHQVARL
jgi:uncharacterized protein